ncbi:MAG: hypothetical protein OXM61_20015 [Candidatus Poribacteria bacterium]|nr:hypothetical protein [Candidatus Poribacteria bacterium]
MMSVRTYIGITAFFLLILMLTLVDIASPAIVFKSNRNGLSDLYVMSNNGKNVRQLTDTPFWDTSPRWSPDGKHIIFMRDLGPAGEQQAQQVDIFIIHADGSNERRLTHHPLNDVFLCWSPDGSHIAFSGRRSGNGEIHIMEIASGDIRQLTKNNPDEEYSSKPSWSPDGQHIVHEQVIAGGGRHIYITNIDGKNTRPFLKGDQPHFVGDTVISKYTPLWSPDGKHVMYFEDHLRYEPDRVVRLANHLIVVDKNGSNPKKLKILKSWWIGTACWAANGTQILFSALPNGFNEKVNASNKLNIYRYHLSTGKITQITDTPNHKDSSPDWTQLKLSVSPKDKLGVQWGKIKEEK